MLPLMWMIFACRTPADPIAEGRWLDTAAPPEVEPREGRWLIDDVISQDATCDPALVAELARSAFKVKPTDQVGEFDLCLEALDAETRCRIGGDGFVCDPISIQQPVDGLDAVLVLQLSNEGLLLAPEEMTGLMLGQLDCAGSACVLEALSELQLPCDAQLTYAALHESL